MNPYSNATRHQLSTMSVDEQYLCLTNSEFLQKNIRGNSHEPSLIELIYRVAQIKNLSREQVEYILRRERVNYNKSTITKQLTVCKRKYGILRTDSHNKSGNHKISYPFDTRYLTLILPHLNKIYCMYINKDFLSQDIYLDKEQRMALASDFIKIAMLQPDIILFVQMNSPEEGYDQIRDFFLSMLQLEADEQKLLYDKMMTNLSVNEVSYEDLIPQPKYKQIEEDFMEIGNTTMTVDNLKKLTCRYGSIKPVLDTFSLLNQHLEVISSEK